MPFMMMYIECNECVQRMLFNDTPHDSHKNASLELCKITLCGENTKLAKLKLAVTHLDCTLPICLL